MYTRLTSQSLTIQHNTVGLLGRSLSPATNNKEVCEGLVHRSDSFSKKICCCAHAGAARYRIDDHADRNTLDHLLVASLTTQSRQAAGDRSGHRQSAWHTMAQHSSRSIGPLGHA